MPPKCCSIIPLSAVTNLLNRSQIELYKAKYEEWATPDRIYCPIPTCSAFIPQRLYIKIRQGPSAQHNDSFNLGPSTQNDTSKKDRKSHVACPTCGVAVCTNCRTLRHVGECPESDLDPALEEQLKKWKIKRCPKCRAGVRRMYGCSHIECRCGAHFCWECLLPINQCGVSFLLLFILLFCAGKTTRYCLLMVLNRHDFGLDRGCFFIEKKIMQMPRMEAEAS
jgi:predicted RNA-binding Zn-ribbon protein involved in translation (DUF1610 family)